MTLVSCKQSLHSILSVITEPWEILSFVLNEQKVKKKKKKKIVETCHNLCLKETISKALFYTLIIS